MVCWLRGYTKSLPLSLRGKHLKRVHVVDKFTWVVGFVIDMVDDRMLMATTRWKRNQNNGEIEFDGCA